MNSTNLEVVISAKDEASSKLKSFTSKVKEMEPAFKAMAVAGAVAFGAITAIVASSANAYAESERNQRQLEHAIIAVSKGTSEQVKQVNELTSALQKKAGIDGDALNAGVAQLSTFGLQSKSVVALTKSLADLTVNQKGVKATTDDYIGSANIMAKALNGQFGLLEKMGIRFTEAQKHLIEFGSETERISSLQEGFAQNLRETTDTVKGYDVMIGKLKQGFGELQESIGKSLQDNLDKIAERIGPILDRVTEWIDKNKELAAKILEAGFIIAGFVAIIGTLGVAVASLSFLFNPINLAIVGITVVIGILVAAFTVFKDEINKFFEEFDAKTGLITFFKEAWADMVFFFETTLLPALKDLWKNIEDAMPMIKVFAEVIGVGLVIAIGLAVTIIGGLIIVLIQLSTWLLNIFNFVSKIFIKAWDWVIDKISNLILKMPEFEKAFKTALENIYDFFKPVLDIVTNIWNLMDKIISNAGKLLKGAGGAISGAVNYVQARFAQGGNAMGGSSYLVGERGPELFTPSRNGTVVPNGNFGGGASYNVYIQGGTYLSEDVAGQIGDMIVDRFKKTARI